MSQQSELTNLGWISTTLRLAASYSVLCGLLIVLYPNLVFDLTGAVRPVYPQIWQGLGMMVGLYGFAYALASFDPIRHWPVVFVGLCGKVIGAAAIALTMTDGALSAAWGWAIVVNDLIWWVPLTLILHRAYTHYIGEPDVPAVSLRSALELAKTQRGFSAAELSEQSPILLVFLRHFGCTFCRETLSDLSERREELNANGTRLVIVHLSADENEARRSLNQYALDDVDRISDPARNLYRAIGLRRGRLGQLLGLRVMLRGYQAGIVDGHGIGWPSEDPMQMPGSFLVKDSRVIDAFYHKRASDQPDYTALSVCEAANARMRSELQRAAEVQQTLLPTSLPEVAGSAFAWMVEPTDELAGDTLNVVRLDEDHVALYVLDVSGHGVSSALLSVTLNHWLSPDRGQSGLFTKGSGDTVRIVPPVEVAERLNEQFPMDAETNQYFTLVYGILNTKTFNFRYITAGHPAPILISPTGRSAQLPGTGLPIGLVPQATYAEHSVDLEEGERLYLFSDGILEAGDLGGVEFGIDLVLDELRGSSKHDLEASVNDLISRVKAWRSGAPYPDDLSLLALERTAEVPLTRIPKGQMPGPAVPAL